MVLGGASLKFMVGLQNRNDGFLQRILNNKHHIYEVYFSWGDFPNGRNNQIYSDELTPFEMLAWQDKALGALTAEDISLNLLFNGNCYGRDSQSRKFFEDIEVRASVNMEIGTVEGMEYVSQYFDSYYMKREYNRDFSRIEELKGWCDENGKKLFMLANSGCLNFCSAHNFHDNLVAHESEISAMDNAYNFGGVCHEFLSDEKNYPKLIERTNFVRPEDMHKYDGYFCAAKLATRVHKNPSMVLDSYVRASYSGDILRLLEPAHSIYPYVIENGETIKLKKINIDIYTQEGK